MGKASFAATRMNVAAELALPKHVNVAAELALLNRRRK
jgi:hypothetical protein